MSQSYVTVLRKNLAKPQETMPLPAADVSSVSGMSPNVLPNALPSHVVNWKVVSENSFSRC